MKSIKYLFCALSAILAAGCDDSEVFYSARYDIVKIEVEVTTQEPVDPEDPDAPVEETVLVAELPGRSAAAAGTDPAVDLIGEAAALRSFVQAAGGSYLLDYTRYDGGRLTVLPSADAAPVEGEFDRQPAAKALTFRCYGLEETYTMERYTDEATGTACVKLSIDLTAYFQELYPDASITGVHRYEYTSTRY